MTLGKVTWVAIRQGLNFESKEDFFKGKRAREMLELGESQPTQTERRHKTETKDEMFEK